MSKRELDKIEVESKRIGTVGEVIEEITDRTGKEKLDEVEVRSKKSGTETGKVDHTRKVIPFQKYEIVIDLTSDGKFIEIVEVRIKKDFRDYDQMIRQRAFEYIDSYQPE
jgi:hypothetical protein